MAFWHCEYSRILSDLVALTKGSVKSITGDRVYVVPEMFLIWFLICDRCISPC